VLRHPSDFGDGVLAPNNCQINRKFPLVQEYRLIRYHSSSALMSLAQLDGPAKRAGKIVPASKSADRRTSPVAPPVAITISSQTWTRTDEGCVYFSRPAQTRSVDPKNKTSATLAIAKQTEQVRRYLAHP